MNRRFWALTLMLAGAIPATVAVGVAVQQKVNATLQPKGGTDDTGPYDVVPNWLHQFKAGTGVVGYGVAVESPNRIFVTAGSEIPIPAGRGGAGRGASATPAPEHFVFVVDGSGKLIEEWTQWASLFKEPHAAEINPYDPDKHVWVIDNGIHQIFEFTNDGKKLVMTLGEKGVAGTDEKHFGRESDVAFLPDGSFYVSDGYDNTRVIKFDKNGKFMFAWGTKGTGPSQFNLVHCVAVDSQRRVYVADRVNSRIQIFDPNGKYIDEWDNIRGPNHIMMTQDGFLWLAAGVGNRMVKYDLTGKLITYWGMYGAFPGAFDDPHQMGVDSTGNLYVAETSRQMTAVQKFVPKTGADRTRLVGQSLLLK